MKKTRIQVQVKENCNVFRTCYHNINKETKIYKPDKIEENTNPGFVISYMSKLR